MAQTYAWVVEQEFIKLQKDNKSADHWVLEQQIFLADNSSKAKRARKVSGTEGQRPKEWNELMYGYREEAARWMKHEEQARRLAVEREKEKTRVVQEEIRRIEARIRQRRNQEREKLAEERTRVNADLQERQKRERTKTERVVIDAWRHYEARWAALMGSSGPLTFRAIPWPIGSPPSSPAGIKPADVVLFLFSPLHSQNQSRKDRIRSAQLRWHPDRFRRLLGRVTKGDIAMVEEGVGIIARCLNDLMARETSLLQHVRLIHLHCVLADASVRAAPMKNHTPPVMPKNSSGRRVERLGRQSRTVSQRGLRIACSFSKTTYLCFMRTVLVDFEAASRRPGSEIFSLFRPSRARHSKRR